jgi:hypothetical protein
VKHPLRHSRPSHPALNVRDDRDTPLCTRRDVTKIADFQKIVKRNILPTISKELDAFETTRK